MRLGFHLFTILLLMGSSGLHGQAGPPARSPVIFTFATVGDSRGEPGAAGNSAQDELWVQNAAVAARMFNEIGRQHPQALVFNGDMIYGYTTDLTVLDRQYAFWRGMVTGLLAGGTYVLPVPGNHEVQVPTAGPDGRTIKLAVETHEGAWRRNMGDLILNTALWKRLTGSEATAWRVENRPLTGSDGISTNQEQLSYSFDVGPIHLAVINTDPVGRDGSVPLAWLQADLAAAKVRGCRRFFVFGHKMPFTYVPQGKKVPKEGGLEGRRDERDAFWDLVEAYSATYFCGHQHVYHASQPRLAEGGKAWQVIVGSGGSPFGFKPGQTGSPLDRMYAWASVSVREDGGVSVQVLGFDERLGPTRILESFEIPK